MPQPTLGKLERVALRELWKHEERDFTPWLAQNIDQLSDLLGVGIVVEQTEKRVGSYELDIFGRAEETNAIVIVENQLEATDHGHLGQLMTYAAGLDAAIIVWVAPEVRDEHRVAIKWLNSKTVDSVSFFLVRPEAFSINGSPPAVRLNLEAGPSDFARNLRGATQSESSLGEFFRGFWEDLNAYLVAHGYLWMQGRTAPRGNWIATAVGKTGMGGNVSFAQGSRMRVEIYLGGTSAKDQFDLLAARRPDIEKDFPDEDVSWERLDDKIGARVAVYRPYDRDKISDASPEREAMFAWIAANLAKFRAIAKKYLVDGQPA